MKRISQLNPRLQTKQVTPEFIVYIVETIARPVAPRQIILFGSHAQGEAAQTAWTSSLSRIVRCRTVKCGGRLNICCEGGGTAWI
jgi:hypothetical protein